MKLIGIMPRILSKIPRKIKVSTKKMQMLATFLIFVIFILSLGVTQQTLGMFSRSFAATDSAMAAEFDVTITAPKEFGSEQGESNFEYHFLSGTDIQGVVFQVTNNGGDEILCRPYINSNITYRVYIDGDEVTEFLVPANETVSFWLLIAPDGLDTNMRNAKLFVDIQQVKGR